MADIHDVAAYIIAKRGLMTAMKLQKLAYYSYAWHLVWEERPLFDARIEAWANGPVVRELYARHRGQFSVATWEGSQDNLEPDEISTIDAVLGYYGDFSAHQLSELTHREAPWRDARAGFPEGTRSSAPITDAALYEYYDGLTSSPS